MQASWGSRRANLLCCGTLWLAGCCFVDLDGVDRSSGQSVRLHFRLQAGTSPGARFGCIILSCFASNDHMLQRQEADDQDRDVHGPQDSFRGRKWIRERRSMVRTYSERVIAESSGSDNNNNKLLRPTSEGLSGRMGI